MGRILGSSGEATPVHQTDIAFFKNIYASVTFLSPVDHQRPRTERIVMEGPISFCFSPPVLI